MNADRKILLSGALLWLSLLACRPVFAIGWRELILLAIIIVFLFGPFLWKVFRAYNKITKADGEEEKEK